MKYAHYNADTGRLIGWYSLDINETIPTPSIEVEDSIWQDMQGKQVVVIDGVVQEYVNTPEEELHNENKTKIFRAKVYLESTDFKMLPDYTPRPDGESIEEIKIKRAEARETIRDLEKSRSQ